MKIPAYSPTVALQPYFSDKILDRGANTKVPRHDPLIEIPAKSILTLAIN